MAKANTTLMLATASAAILAGVLVWSWDDLAARWRAAPAPTALPAQMSQASGVRPAAPPQAEAPSFAFVPSFGTDSKTNSELLAHYAKQIPLDKTPTLEDWQNLINGMPKDVPGSKPLTLPLGPNHFVMSMCRDMSGNLWIGTEGEGVFRYTPGARGCYALPSDSVAARLNSRQPKTRK